ncbi:MAG: hypothetical protein MOB07_18985 [Acidobacteria bacterium]|nr:hypothetical protein [Acidobacteriota bacterium]
MEDNSRLIWYLTVWIIAAGIVFFTQLRKGSTGSGLSLAYLLNLWIIHWVASALYALPEYSYYEFDTVLAGLEQSTYAVVAFSAGYVIITCASGRVSSRQISDNKPHVPGERPHISDARLTDLYIGIGAAFFLLSVSGLGKLPTATSLITGASNLAVVGLMLKSWRAWRSGNSFLFWVSVSLAYPLLTIITQGFIGYGIFNTLMVFTFVAGFYRPRWRLVVLGFAAVYLGLSVYVTYMRDRGVIRDTVWGEQSYESRLDQLKATLGQAEFFDINDDEHLKRIDLRLNQNALIGASVHYIESGQQEFARGETLWEAIIALIPRVFWPEKSVVAGSGDLVATYTGYYFAEGTSVGIGHVMEFYINFGQWGVIAGFLILGSVLAWIDKGAGKSLADNDWLSFACWYLPGAAFLQVGGSFVEVTASAAASLAVALLVKWLVSWVRRYEVGIPYRSLAKFERLPKPERY